MQDGSGNSDGIRHVRAEPLSAQETLRSLKNHGYVDYRYRVFNRDGYVYIPVSDNFRGEGYTVVNIRGVIAPEGKYPSRQKGSYDLIGQIAIIHRRDDARTRNLALNIIGSSPVIKSVFLDTGISGTFRVRDLKLLAGEDIRNTLYRENGIKLHVDLSKAYFSPRLATERMRVSRAVKDGERIIDMFAGIGPFSILIAKMHDVSITALDSNPAAIEMLDRNVGMNKLKGRIRSICTDSMLYMKEVRDADRVIMNLPHDASEFLEAAAKSVRVGGTVHYYEICSVEKLEERMEKIGHLGLNISAKREVHGYSKDDRMYALDLRKIL